MMQLQNILAVGENTGRTKQRVDAMRRLGYIVEIISSVSENFKPGINEHISFYDRVCNKLGFPNDKTFVNRRALQQLQKKKYDVMWVEKSLVLKPATLKEIKKNFPLLKIIWYSEDDMFARHNQSYYFKKSLPYYDIVFTTKSYNGDAHELPALGAKKVIFVDKAYDPICHRPLILSDEEKKQYGADVGFIGTFEQDRFEKMFFLAQQGVAVRVWGNGWKPHMHAHSNLHIENRPLYDDDYIKAICATKINLCFLRKINRDLQTDRTMEIPACRAFMLAERTDEHLRLFSENKEAAYFDIADQNELYQKVKYFLQHDDERKIIAQNGYQRCMHSHYSHDDRLWFMLSCIE